MSLSVQNNVAAMNAYRNLSATQNNLSSSLEKLSSGFRINRAADDAAGLVKSEGLRAEIRGTDQAIQNAQDGVSFVQTAEGALNEVHSILQRMRELAVSAAITATSDGAAEQPEIAELLQELHAIGARTTIAGTQVFSDYSSNELTFQVGAGHGAANQLSIDTDLALDTTGAGGLFGSLQVAGDPDPAAFVLSSIDLETGAGARTAIEGLDAAIASVSEARSELGATQNRLEHTID